MLARVKFDEPKCVLPYFPNVRSEILIDNVESVEEFDYNGVVTISTTFYGVLELTDVEEIRFIF